MGKQLTGDTLFYDRNTGVGAGFTTGKPWLALNPNYPKVNAKDQVAREDSVFHYYPKLIALRKEYEIIVYGHYDLLLPEDPGSLCIHKNFR